MSNKKVYLAKNILASGFDVEYVKSSLLRIPGIDIVEAGMGIKPSECASFVIVPDDEFEHIDYESISISKNVAKDLKEFLKCSSQAYPVESVYIYSGRENAKDWDDVENIFAAIFVLDNDEVTTVDKDNYDSYAQICALDTDDLCLLDGVSIDICVNDSLWKKNPRHPQPKPEYAIPPVPSLEDRRMKKSPIIMDEVGSMSHDYWRAAYPATEKNCINKRMLLLRRK